jgi:holo-[acyl-carrier protein] synthase
MSEATSGIEVRVGCDVQSVAEVRAALADHRGRYLRRVLGNDERAEVESLDRDELVARYVTGRFAAKEAVYKALRGAPDVALPWSQIEIVADESGAPRVRLHGAAADLAAGAGIGEVAVSISHAEPFAFAVATAVVTSA